MFKGNYKKIFLSLLLLLMVFSPLEVVRGQHGGILPADTARRIQGEPTNNGVEIQCGIFQFGFAFIDVDCLLAKTSFNLLYLPAAGFLSLSGRAFDWITEKTIINMRKNLYPPNGDKSDGSGITIMWKIFRDIANILFIFVLLYVSILTIIKGIGSTGTMIASVIVVALLINFSLFLTEVVIDISNTTAISFYNSITYEPGELEAGDLTFDTSIASPFIEKTKIATIMSANGKGDGEINLRMVIYQAILGAIVLFIMGIVLFFISIMLITRFISLLVILAISSIAVGSFILPQLKNKIFDKWLSELIGQSLFAPIFFLFLYISLIILNTLPVQSGTWSNVFKLEPGTVFSYFMVVGLLIASLKISKSLADQAKSGSNLITKQIGAGAIGGAGWLGRRSFGWAGKQASERIAGNNFASRALKRGAARASNSSYDLRNSKVLSKTLDYTTGVKDALGEGKGIGGYSALRKEKDEKRDKISEIIKAPTIKEREAKLALAKRKKELEDEDSDFFKDYGKAKKDKAKAERNIKRYEQEIKNINQSIMADRGGNAAYTDSLKKQLENAQKSKTDTLANLNDINEDIKVAEAKMGDNYDNLKKAAKKAGEASENRTSSYANAGFFGKISPARREYARRHREKIVKKS